MQYLLFNILKIKCNIEKCLNIYYNLYIFEVNYGITGKKSKCYFSMV